MSKVGKGVPPPAKITNIIGDLFENEKIKNLDNTRSFVTFSRAQLTNQQKKSLTYSEGSIPTDLYIVYQTDQFDMEGNLISTSSQLISFIKKNDGFTYGYYYKLLNQKRWNIDKLAQSSEPIKLSMDPIFVFDNYIEVYHNVLGTTVILGLGTEIGAQLASLQYTHKSKYFYEILYENGIEEPTYPITILVGLSKNLSKFD